uniref:Uncharacterized protein n=1 Tax=Parascaris univalens TaxID=6257 RepID=A0A914ZZW6_PARUN
MQSFLSSDVIAKTDITSAHNFCNGLHQHMLTMCDPPGRCHNIIVKETSKTSFFGSISCVKKCFAILPRLIKIYHYIILRKIINIYYLKIVLTSYIII